MNQKYLRRDVIGIANFNITGIIETTYVDITG